MSVGSNQKICFVVLGYDPYHPSYIIQNISKGHFIRIQRLCSEKLIMFTIAMR